MKIMKKDVFIIFLLLGWIDTAVARSPVKGRVRSSKLLQLQTNKKTLSLDLSSDGSDPSKTISPIFVSTLKSLQPQLQLQRSITIELDITAPPGSRQAYLENIENTIRSLLQQMIGYPMESFISTRIQGNDDGTIASITISVSVSPSKTQSRDYGSIRIDLSKPGIDISKMLRTTLTMAVQNPSIHANGDKSNHITLEIIPPQGFTKGSVHDIIGSIESILAILLPNEEFSIKASISERSGLVTRISCDITIEGPSSRNNSFNYNIDLSKRGSLNTRITTILQNIRSKVNTIFNENKPVFLNLKVKPLPNSNKQSIATTVDSILSIVRKAYPNPIEVTVNIYENSRHEVNSIVLDIIIEPRNAIEIDFTVPTSISTQQITNEVTKIKSKLRQPIDKSTSFTLILQPPANADDSTIEKITHLVISTISRIFPDNQVKIQATTTKNDDGSVSRITLVITIEPTSFITDRPVGESVSIDLSKPGMDLTQQISNILPNLKNKFNKDHPVPVTLTVSIVPPRKSTEDFIRKTSSPIMVTLSGIFPQDRIKSEATAEKDPHGYLKNVRLVFTIIPGTSPQEPIDTKTLSINLEPGRNLVSEITNILPQLNKLIDTDQPIKLNLKVQPPKGATDKTVKDIVKSVITTISKKYPYNELEVQVKTMKDPKGSIVNVIIVLTIAPTDKKTPTPSPEEFSLDLTKPGKNIVTEIVNVLPVLKNKITDQTKEGRPSTIQFKIKPPSHVTSDYVKKSTDSVMTIISKLFPQDQISVKAKMKKNPHGKITEIILVITVEPKTGKPKSKDLRPSTTPKTTEPVKPCNEINLDLSKPGTNPDEEIKTILSKIKLEISSKPQEKKPVKFVLNIQPPDKSNQQFLDDTVYTILTTLKKLFPHDRTEVNLRIPKNKNKDITHVTLSLVISPKNVDPESETTTENELFTTPTPENLHEVELDLTKPGTNVQKVVTDHILPIKSEITKNNEEEEPVTFKFNIQPPKDSDEDYVKKTVNTIMTTLSHLFPDKKVVMNVRITKNPDGRINTITMVFDIEPPSDISTTTTPGGKPTSTPAPTTINLDFSKPGTKPEEEIFKILPDINTEVLKKHPKGKPVKLEFNINPPDNSNDSSVKSTVETIVDVLERVFPDSSIHYKVKVIKDKNHKITNVTVVLSIDPTSKTKNPFLINLVTKEKPDEETTEPTHETTTPSGVKPVKFELDLSKPGSNVVSDLVTIIPNIEKKVKIEHPKKKPVTVEFEVKPSVDSTVDTVKDTTKTILEVFKNKFPHKKIKISYKIKKDKNTIDKVIIVLTIEPSPTTKTTTSRPGTGRHSTEPDEEDETTKKWTPSSKEITESNTRGTRPQKESVRTTTPIIGTRPSKKITTTPSTGRITFKGTTTPSEEITESEEQTIPEESTPSNEEITKTYTEGTRPHTKQHTRSTSGIKFKQTTPSSEEITESVIGKTTPSTNEKGDTTINMDLSKPGTNLQDYVEEVIPKIIPNVKPILEKKEPVSFTFKIKPPRGSDPTYIKDTSETLVDYLTKFFPDDKISVKINGHKNPRGELTDVTVLVTVEPSKPSSKTFEDRTEPTTEETSNEETEEISTRSTPSTRPTTNEKGDTTITVDLSKPGTNLQDYVEEVIPKIIPNIKPLLEKKQPVSFTFKIKPPRGSDPTYMKDTSETLVDYLTKFFPDDKISVKINGHKNPRGELTDVTVLVIVEPSKPSSKTFEDRTKPTTEETSNEETEEISTRTTPSTRPTTNEKGDTTITVDLSKPGTNLQDYVEEVIPKIIPNVKPILEKKEPVSFTFKIKPPRGSDPTYIKDTSETLVDYLTKFFPDDKISVKINGHKNPRGELTDVTVLVTVEPSKPSSKTFEDRTEPTTEETSNEETEEISTRSTPSTRPTTNEKGDTTITVDLSKPGTNLQDYVEEVIPKIIPNIKPLLEKKQPVSFTFKIKPPRGSDPTYMKDTSETLVDYLTELFPDDQISVKINGHKNPRGDLTDVTVLVIVDPSKPSSKTFEDRTEPTTEETSNEETEETSTGTTSSTTPTTNEKGDTTITVDLSKPGTNLQDYVEEVIPKIIPNVKPVLEKKEPVSFTFKIKPPRGSDPSYLKDTSETLVNYLTKFFPNDKISVKINGQKDPQGNLTDVTILVIVEPSKPSTITFEDRTEPTTTTPRYVTGQPISTKTPTTNENGDTTITVDLSKPGTNLQDYVEEVIPKIIPNIKPVLEKKEPVSFTFKIKPPRGSDPSYLKDTSETLVNYLTKLFPNDKISVKINGQKDPQGNLTDVTILVIVEPSKPSTITFDDRTKPTTTPRYVTVQPISTTPTTNEKGDTTITVDLSKPGTNLQDYVEEVIPTIIPNIKPVLEKKQPVTFTFKIKPPRTADPNYMKDTSQTLINTLSKFFPNNKISVKINGQKDPQGYLTDVTILVIIEPSPTQDRPTQEVDIDLSRPGSNLPEEVTRFLPGILPQVTSELSKKSPVTINFVIKPPTMSTEDYLHTTVQSLSQILTKYFPENKMKVQVNAEKNPQGYLSEVTVLITIQPATTTTPKSDDIDIDLSKPGVTLVTEIPKIIPSILPEVKKALNDKQPVTLSFKIKPRPGTTESHIPVITKVLQNFLTQYFPGNKIDVNVNAKKNPQGHLTEIDMVITIEPPTSQEPERNIIINLEKPGSTLVDEVQKIIPSISNNINDKLSKNLPVTLDFKIKPPTGSTDSYIQQIVEPLQKLLVTYWPNNKVNIQVTAQKDSRGYLTQIVFEIILEPSPTNKPGNERVDIDLSKPGTKLTDQINTVMPSILPNINDNLSKQRPVTLNFNIKPPTGSTDNYLQDITQSLQNILVKYFPNNKIDVNVSANKNPQGYLTIITIEITVQPAKPTTSAVKNVDIDLTKPGSNLVDQVTQKIPLILKDVKDTLSKKEPTTLSFKIKPPPGSTESYLQVLGSSLMDILKNYFPSNQINVKMSAQKDSRGYLSVTTIEIVIQPSSTPDDEDVDMDLTKPGATLSNEMEKILPNVRQQVTDQLASNQPVSLNFKIKPPQGSTDSYLQVLTGSLQNILTKYFPNNELSIEISAQKNYQGYLTLITLDIHLTPSNVQPSNDQDVDIDLSKPGVTLTNQIPQILPSILPKINNDLSGGKPVTVNFKIRPPPGATESYMQVTAQTLATLLAKYLPENAISVEISAQKNSQNQLSLITIQITVQPSSRQLPKQPDVLIDLSRPGVNLVNEVSQYLVSVSPGVTSKISTGQPVNITLDIKPPHGSTESYIQIIAQSIVPILSKYFPNYKVNLETSARKDSRGYISDIILVICIEPSQKQQDYTVDIDLQNTRYTLAQQVDNIIPNILPTIQNDLDNGESVTLNFKVLPPSRSGDSFLQTFTQDLVPILSKFFPGNSMSIKSNAQKNSQGYLINVTVQITIKSSSQIKKIDIDLSRPGSSLQSQVSYLLPPVMTGLQSDLSQGKPITLKFNIRPPMYSNRSFQNLIANQLVQILPRYFPNKRMSIKTSAQEDSNGYISDIVLVITIQP